ncbi:MAG: helix-turn-helix domain-containing protein [Acidobacteriota bacterium]
MQIKANTTEKNLDDRSTVHNKSGERASAKKRTSAAAMMESVFACKWSARIILSVHQGIRRPGAIIRSLDGLTTKVLNECMRRMIGLGLIKRTSYPETPPRVEYHLSEIGERFVSIIHAVEELQREMNAQGK